jgi:hypothetical protein
VQCSDAVPGKLGGPEAAQRAALTALCKLLRLDRQLDRRSASTRSAYELQLYAQRVSSANSYRGVPSSAKSYREVPCSSRGLAVSRASCLQSRVPVEASMFLTLSHCKRQKKPQHASIAASGALVRPCESLLSCTVASGIAARAAAALHHC